MDRAKPEIEALMKICHVKQVNDAIITTITVPGIFVLGFLDIVSSEHTIFNIFMVIVSFIMMILFVMALVQTIFMAFRANKILKAVKHASSVDELTEIIKSFSEECQEFSKDFILGESYKVHSLKKAKTISK